MKSQEPAKLEKNAFI